VDTCARIAQVCLIEILAKSFAKYITFALFLVRASLQYELEKQRGFYTVEDY